MGSIGNKPKKFRSTETFDEPELLVDLESIRNKAREEGYVNGNRFDVERFIRDKYPTIIIKREALASDISGKLKNENGECAPTLYSVPRIRSLSEP